MKLTLRILGVAALLSVAQSSQAGDVDNYLIAKGQEFHQTNSSVLVQIPGETPFQAFTSVMPSAPGLVTNATLRGPSGQTIELETNEDGSFEAQASFTNKSTLDLVAPAGTYTFTISTVNDGTKSPALTLPADAYPATPKILNWLDAQEVEKSQPFTLRWSSFTNGTVNDYIMVDISELDGTPVWNSPQPLETNGLNGTQTSTVVPADALGEAHSYDGRLLFVRRSNLNTNSIPGAIGLSGYFKQTKFPFVTLPEAPPGGRVEFSARDFPANENDGNAVVTVTRTGGESNAISVTVSTSDGSATDGQDFTGINTLLTFPEGVTSTNVLIPLTDDFQLENDETFNVTLASLTGGAVLGNRSNAVVTIVDNERATAGTLQFNPVTVSIGEAGPVATLTVQRTGGTVGSASLTYHTIGGTAISDVDFVSTNGTLVFAAAQASKTITVPIINDSLDETNETFSVILDSVTGGAAFGTNLTAVVTITDNDTAGAFALSSASYSTNENNPLLLVTVTRGTTGTASGASVDFTTVDGVALAGLDYFPTNGTLTFGSNEVSKVVAIGITNDTLAEGNETFSFRLSNPGGNAKLGAITNATLTIRDDESSVSFSNANYTVSEAGPSVSINVIRSGALITPVSVNFSTSDGSAVSTNDYRGTNGTLVFPVNAAFKTITIPIANDTIVEPNESFNLFLHSPSNGVQLGTITSTTVTITNNDAGGVISFSTTNYTTPEAGPAKAVTISRTGGSASGVSVWFYTADGSATAGADYTAVSNQVTFNSTETSKTVTVPVINDALDETNEIVLLSLGNVQGGASLGARSNATLTITDNDVAGAIGLSSATYATNENSPFLLVTVTRGTSGTAGGATVDFTTVDGVALAGLDYFPTNGTLTFGSNEVSKVVAIGITNDTLAEGNETFSFRLSNPGGNAKLGAITNATLTIRDDESSVSFSNANYTVSEAGPSVSINVIRSGALITPVSVNFSTSDGSAVSTNDYRGTNGTLVFPVNAAFKTITIPIANDTIVEPNESFNLFLHSPSNGVQLGTITSTTVTITNNDAGGVISFSTTNYTTPEAGPAKAVTISRTGGSASGVSVWFYTADGSATAGADYTAVSNQVTFNSTETSKTVNVPVINDALDETNEIVLLALGNVQGGATLGARSNATLTITDNDVAGAIGLSSATYATNENSPFLLVTVTRGTSGTAGGATVDFTTVDGVALAGLDYFPTNGTLTFASNEVSKVIAIGITNDTLAEGNEPFAFVLSNPGGNAKLGTIAGATLTIRDDESSISFTNMSYTFSEAGPLLSVNIIRSGALITPVSVGLTTVDGSAVSTNDYLGVNTTLNLPANISLTIITLPIFDDTIVEGSEAFSIFLHSPSNGVQLGTITNVTINIADNDQGGVINFKTAVFTSGENSNAVVVVTRTNGAASGVSVTLTTQNGSATGGLDYSDASQTITFGAGETSKNVVVPIINDALDETNETVQLFLSNAQNGGTLGTVSNATLTITDNDSGGVFHVGSQNYSTNENAGAFLVTVIRSGGNASGVTVDFFTTNGTATAGADFVATNGTLSFGSNELSRTISVPIINDTNPEGAETLSLILTNATGGATVSTTNTATLTIIDDESSISLTNAAYVVGETGPSVSITAVRSGALGTAVSVQFTTLDGSAVSPGDYLGTNRTLNFPTGTSAQTVVIPIVNDTIDENDETFTAFLSNPLGGVQLGTTTNATVTITDNDTAGSIQFSAATFSGTEGSNAAVRITRTGGVASGVTVEFTMSGGTATAGSDYTLVNTNLAFAAGETNKIILIPILTDGTNESVETVGLTLSLPGGGATLGATSVATLNINNAPDPNAIPLAGTPFFTMTATGTNFTFSRTLTINTWGTATSGSVSSLFTNIAVSNIDHMVAHKQTTTVSGTTVHIVYDDVTFNAFQILGLGPRTKDSPPGGTIVYTFLDQNGATTVASYGFEWESGAVMIDGMSVDGAGNITAISGRIDIIAKNNSSEERVHIVGSFRTKP